MVFHFLIFCCWKLIERRKKKQQIIQIILFSPQTNRCLSVVLQCFIWTENLIFIVSIMKHITDEIVFDCNLLRFYVIPTFNNWASIKNSPWYDYRNDTMRLHIVCCFFFFLSFFPFAKSDHEFQTPGATIGMNIHFTTIQSNINFDFVINQTIFY